MYLDRDSQIQIENGSNIQFIGNTASQQGGTVYIKFSFNCPQLIAILCTGLSSVTFINNSALFTGNSIYYDIPETCDSIRDPTSYNSVMHVPNKFNYTQFLGSIGPPITTSPYQVSLCSTVFRFSNNTGSSCNISSRIMLGQLTSINATICDYYVILHHSASQLTKLAGLIDQEIGICAVCWRG